jgi:serine/threonine-protein kinase
MGEMYRARDTKLKRDVAIKVLPDAFARDPDRMVRFQREAELLGSLNHPNIAHIYGIEERALVMELVEGESPKWPMRFEEAWKIALQIAEALSYAHEKGVVHRDLKPANIKVTPDGVVKLLDFGLAKAFSRTPDSMTMDPENLPTQTLDTTVAGVILGTAAYMSPEQARGKHVDRRADIWAFGVVLYELLTGKQLFQGEDLTDTLASVVKVQPDLSAAPEQARRVLQACLEKDPKKRLQAIGDVKYLVGQTAGPDSSVALPRWFVAGTLAVMTIALGVALWPPWRSERPAAGVARLTMDLAPAAILGPMNYNRPLFTSLAISPDGNT